MKDTEEKCRDIGAQSSESVPERLGFFPASPMTNCGTVLGGSVPFGSEAVPTPSERKTSTNSSAHHSVLLKGLTLVLSRPRVVAETAVGRCWYPDLLRFSTGELMLNYSLNADANDNRHNSQVVCISTDQGRTFDFTYDVNGFHNSGGEPRISLADGRIVGTSAFLRPDPPGQWRRFVAHYWSYENGGRRYTVDAWGATVEGLPRDVERLRTTTRTWWGRINWFGDIVELESGTWISTISMRFRGDKRESTLAVISRDAGCHWHYLSTVAGADAISDAKEGFDEPCLIRLADGDLMCVSRVGPHEDQKLARTYSSDGGKTWSPIDRLPAFSVAPQMCRIKNGILALSTGRPGLFLWLATDPRGNHWQSLDVMVYHNSVVGEALQITVPREEPTAAGRSTNDDGIVDLDTQKQQTTAYTALVEVTQNRVFLVYDRSPFGWKPVPAQAGERSQIFLIEIDIWRT